MKLLLREAMELNEQIYFNCHYPENVTFKNGIRQRIMDILTKLDKWELSYAALAADLVHIEKERDFYKRAYRLANGIPTLVLKDPEPPALTSPEEMAISSESPTRQNEEPDIERLEEMEQTIIEMRNEYCEGFKALKPPESTIDLLAEIGYINYQRQEIEWDDIPWLERQKWFWVAHSIMHVYLEHSPPAEEPGWTCGCGLANADRVTYCGNCDDERALPEEPEPLCFTCLKRGSCNSTNLGGVAYDCSAYKSPAEEPEPCGAVGCWYRRCELPKGHDGAHCHAHVGSTVTYWTDEEAKQWCHKCGLPYERDDWSRNPTCKCEPEEEAE